MKHKVSVEGITCANCALKIEDKLKKKVDYPMYR